MLYDRCVRYREFLGNSVVGCVCVRPHDLVALRFFLGHACREEVRLCVEVELFWRNLGCSSCGWRLPCCFTSDR